MLPPTSRKYDTTEDLKEGGTFLLNCPWTTEELEEHLPAKMKRDLARKHAQFYIIDAAKLAAEIGLGKRTNNILQGAFFALTKVIPMDVAVADMKKNNYATYFKKAGQKIVDLNDKAVDLGVSAAVKVEIPASWADAQDAPVAEPKGLTPFVRDIVMPMDRQKGDQLPVSVFQKYGVLDGTWENGTSVFSKRGVATKVPKWDGSKCIQCNRCSMCVPPCRHPSCAADGLQFAKPLLPVLRRLRWLRGDDIYQAFEPAVRRPHVRRQRRRLLLRHQRRRAILPYCKDCQGHGPAWEHSLFEDNAEFAYGFLPPTIPSTPSWKSAVKKPSGGRHSGRRLPGLSGQQGRCAGQPCGGRPAAGGAVHRGKGGEHEATVNCILQNPEFLSKEVRVGRSAATAGPTTSASAVWITSLPPTRTSMLVLDTEVYSNTGGQASRPPTWGPRRSLPPPASAPRRRI